MQSQALSKYNLPDKPGIYFFKSGAKILYVGKATSLADRVRSYFGPDLEVTRGPAIRQMVALADDLAFIETDSVLEALILEAAQIKKHRPKYNAKAKDDKSFNFVVITKEDFPRVLLVRGKQLREDEKLAKQIRYQFGPFPNGGELKEALKIIRRILPYRDKCEPCVIASGNLPEPRAERGGKQSGLEIASSSTPRNDKRTNNQHKDKCKPCFNAQIGLCPGVCSGAISAAEYGLTIKNLKLLFDGRKKDIVKNLERQMKILAGEQRFEQAGELKRKIFALNHIQDVALIKYRGRASLAGLFRIEAYDIAHLAGQDTVGVMAMVVDGEMDKSSYRKFTIRGVGKDVANDIANLKEVLTRRFSHDEWTRPNLIVLDGGRAQLNAARKILTAREITVPCVAVVKDEFHRAREILGDAKIIAGREREIILANSEAHRFAIHFHRQIRKMVV